MADATFEDFCALAGKVIIQDFPIMPQPTWGQDAAYLAFFIDNLVKENKRLDNLVVTMRSLVVACWNGDCEEDSVQALQKSILANTKKEFGDNA